MAEYKFIGRDYDICKHAKKGELSKIKKMIQSIPKADRERFGPETFCPDPRRERESPIVLACQYGHLDVVKYFLEEFPNITDINKGSRITSKTQKREIYNISPLIAACTNDNMELVKYLISHGADIHKRSFSCIVPLQAAAYYEHLEIMEYLIQCGAEVNVAIGRSPLLAAAQNGSAKATKLLLDKGCNVSQKTIEGYTAMHEAAQKGETEVIKVLLDYVMSPLFATSKPGIKDYVPCPLYLAASVGKRSVVDFLIEREDCPLQCKCDAYLLLAIAKIEYPDVEDNHQDDALQLWLKGLEASEIENAELTSLSSKYLNHTEIRSAEHLQKLWDTQTFKLVDIYFQCLLIRERCMGPDDQSLIECLVKRGVYFSKRCYYKECECVFERAMELEESICETKCSHPQYEYCNGIENDFSWHFGMIVLGIEYTIGYTFNFQRYAQFAIKLLGYLDRIRDKADGKLIGNSDVLSGTVSLMLLWLLNERKVALATKSEFYLPPIFTSLLNELVSNYLYDSCGQFSLLFHMFHTMSKIKFFCGYDLSSIIYIFNVFVEAVMKAGGKECLNTLNSHGRRLLEDASMISKTLRQTGECVSTLIEWGAHIDAVNYLGRTAAHPKYCLQNSSTYSYFVSLGPSPLFCYAARTIVREHLPYQTLGLPNHIVSFVKLHDPQFALARREKDYFSDS